MSVCYNKTRKKYFICYDYKMPDGSYKTMSIYNKEWTKERGKKFVQAIEQDEIDKDIRKKNYIFIVEMISRLKNYMIYLKEKSLYTLLNKLQRIKEMQ